MGRLQSSLPKVGLVGDVLAARVLRRHRPLSLGWEVTAQCNASCAYCGFRERAPGELSTAEALRLIDEMHACGTRMVSLSGGEPLLRGDLPELVAALRARRIGVSLNTNGFLVERRREVLSAVARVKISLDGPEPVHDSVRGKGAWRRAVHGLRLCQAWGVAVVVQTVLSRANLAQLEAHTRWCAERELPLQVQPADARVLHTGEPNPEAPEPAELRLALRRLLDGRGDVLNTRAGLRHLLAWPAPRSMACASGQITARISSTGVLRLCGRPPRDAPESEWRELGLAEAFRRLHPVACDQCWCAPRVDMNLAYRGRGLRDFARGKTSGLVPGLTARARG